MTMVKVRWWHACLWGTEQRVHSGSSWLDIVCTLFNVPIPFRLFRPPSTPPLPLPPTLPVEETICINGPSVPSAELKLTPHHSTSRYPCKSRPSGLSIPRHQLFLWVRVTRPDLSPHVFALTAILAQMNGSRSKGRKAKTTASLA